MSSDVIYRVSGGARLSGSIRPNGNKNAALPLICATLLSDRRVVLHNVPRIRDIHTLLDLIATLGVEVSWIADNSLSIHAARIESSNLDPVLCAKIRASMLLAAPLLARCGSVKLPPPGGDVIGRRRVDTHLLALEELGATISVNGGYTFEARKLEGADIFLDEPSVTATENALMAAAVAPGRTILRNAACEPHVQDLANFLNALGADISGIGSNEMTVNGRETLCGGPDDVEFTVGPDHIEVGSFIGLAAVTNSEIRIVDAGVQHLRSTLMGFARLGIECVADGSDLIVPRDQSRTIRRDVGGHTPTISDQPWPAFPADVMSIMVVAATQCTGTVLIHEKMFESRLFFVDKLIGMGAQIVLCDPHRAVVSGPSRLRAAELSSPDIRAGMAMVLAALCATGESIIHNAGQIERGYERIDERLRALGANIERVG